MRRIAVVKPNSGPKRIAPGAGLIDPAPVSGTALSLNEFAERESPRGVAELQLPRIPRFQGEVRLPGSKSISNRALIMAALCRSAVEIRNLLDADDVRVMRENLPELGVMVLEKPGRGDGSGVGDRTGPVLITGSGGPFKVNRLELNLDNAGTAMRPMTALLAAGSGEFVLDGDEQMRRRPIGELANFLNELGAQVSAVNGCPPLTIKTSGLRGGPLKIRGKLASSQFLSALLMAGPFMRDADLDFELDEEPISKPYIDLTISMMADFGIVVERDGYRRYRVPRGQYESPGVYHVEGDASAATYFMALGALPGSGPVTVHGLSRDSRQGDAGFAGLLSDMGARVEWGENSCTVTGTGALKAPDLDMNHMPDAAMTLAVLALFAEGETHIRNIENLRVKESERIRGLRTELEKLGASVRETPDSLHITPASEYRPASIETYKDHRMAMAFSLAAAATDVRIQDPSCVGKTYPEYFQDFLTLIPENA